MAKLVKVFGLIVGSSIAFYGFAAAVTGSRPLSAMNRGGTQHYWNALVALFGQNGAALVSGGFWFVFGLVVIYFAAAPTKELTKTRKRSNPGRGRHGDD